MSQLTLVDCTHIEILHTMWYSANKIAKELHRDHTVISRELKKYSIDDKYIAEIAWNMRKQIRVDVNKTRKRIKNWTYLAWYIITRIKKYWSPEQVAGRWKLNRWEHLSKDTIYKYIYEHYSELVKPYFRRSWKAYRHHPKDQILFDRRMIDERPIIVDEKGRFWDREWDTIEWKWHKGSIPTNVERKSWFLLASLLQNRKSTSLSQSLYILFKKIPKNKKRTITFDNGREFADHKVVEATTGLKVFFAHPYSPRERPINENTNGLLRQFIPKKTDFTKITPKQLEKYVKLLNNRPRKRLNYHTPTEILFSKH